MQLVLQECRQRPCLLLRRGNTISQPYRLGCRLPRLRPHLAKLVPQACSFYRGLYSLFVVFTPLISLTDGSNVCRLRRLGQKKVLPESW